MISPELNKPQWSEWSIPTTPPIASQKTQSFSRVITDTRPPDVSQSPSKAHPKTESNSSCKPLKWCSSISPYIRGMLLGVLAGCLILAIILPIWLVKPATTTTTKTPVNLPLLRWNPTGITVAGITNNASTASDHLYQPWDLTLDWSNTLYVTDRYNHRVQKFLMNVKNGVTVAGQMNGTSGLNSNQLNQPTGIYVDSNGNIFLSDANNNRIQRWSNGAVSGQTLVGNGTQGAGNSLLYNPYKIWRDDNSGTLYVADSYNHRIMRYVNNAAFGDVMAGGNGFGANTSQLSFPYGFYFDSLSNSLIIANAGTNTIVRWVMGANYWTLVAGDITGVSGNTATLLSSPADVTLDPMGNIYVADLINHRIQFYSAGQSSGVTIAGITGLSGVNSTLLSYPSSLTFDSQLNLYVVDYNNHRIQKFLRY